MRVELNRGASFFTSDYNGGSIQRGTTSRSLAII